jgi:hypothetical protein
VAFGAKADHMPLDPKRMLVDKSNLTLNFEAGPVACKNNLLKSMNVSEPQRNPVHNVLIWIAGFSANTQYSIWLIDY